MNLKVAKECDNANYSRYIRTNIIVWFILILAIVIAILLGCLMSKDINNVLNKINKFAKQLVQCNFSNSIKVNRKNEFGDTVIALNIAQEKVQELVKHINKNFSILSEESNKLLETIYNIYDRIEKINSSTIEISTNARQASAATQEITEPSNKAVDGNKECINI